MSKLSQIKDALDKNPEVVILYSRECGFGLRNDNYLLINKSDTFATYTIAPMNPVFSREELEKFMCGLTSLEPEDEKIVEAKHTFGRLKFNEIIGEEIRTAKLDVNDVVTDGETLQKRNLTREITLEVYSCVEIARSPSSTVPKSKYPQYYEGDRQAAMVAQTYPFYCNSPCDKMAECPFIGDKQKRGEEVEFEPQKGSVFLREVLP